MKSTPQSFWRRLTALMVGLVAFVVLCAGLAFAVQRDAAQKLKQLAHVELQAAALARQFRAAVDDLHGALLRIGTEDAGDSVAVVQQRRQEMSAWLKARLADDLSERERQIVREMVAETRAYFVKLDALNASNPGLKERLDRDAVVMFDDSANRLQSVADDFAAAHDEELRQLLGDSLRSVRWMRNLIYGCLSLLLAALAAVFVVLYRDVVRPLRKQLVDREALLAQREKLAALGTLAAGVAHEIRNPLTAMKARLYTLRRTSLPGESREDVLAIVGEVDRLERIVRDVLDYAHPGQAARRRTELAAWLAEFAAFVQPDLVTSGIELTIDAPQPLHAEVDAGQLRQIVLNLVRNAQEAFAGQPGRLRLTLRREHAVWRGRRAAVAALTVTDNGPGIPAKIQARLFDPFFTTKASGTGLGLSIVARLVENQGGEITFQSVPGAATSFTVRLPLDDARPEDDRA